MSTKVFERLAKQFDELSELIMAIAGTFRDASEGGDGGAVDGKTSKPVRGGSKPAAKSSGKKAKEELTEDDMQEAMSALTKAKGKDALIEALTHVGAGRFSEIDEADWPEFKAKMDELMEADDEVEAAKPAKKVAAKKVTKKKALSLEDDIEPKFSELVDADRAKAKKLLKKHDATKLSELEEDSYAAFLADVEAALEGGDDDDEDLTG